MSENALSKEAYEYLIGHLVSIEEERDFVSETFYSNEFQRSHEFSQFITDYISYISSFIEKSKIKEESATPVPFSTIGSIVEVEDINNNETINYHIISPFAENSSFSLDEDFASYLSPVGKALVLKKPGEKVTVNTPAALQEYIIKSFRFP